MSTLERKLTAREFVVTAELPVIAGGGKAEILRQREPMRPFVDAFNATDNPSAHAHCSPLAVSIGLIQAGVEPVMQLACRDRNRIALEADLMGAAMYGIENICCLTGDDVTAGDEPEARRVFDLDSIQLLALGSSMAQGPDLSGRKLAPAPKLFRGAVETPGAPPYDYRVERAWKKVRAGARFLQLQVSYEPQRLSAFMHEAVEKGLATACALIPSICLVRSPSALRYMDENVPGITVPEQTIVRCESAPDPERACFDVACELAEHARSLPGVAGLHLISFRKEAGVARLCQRLNIPTRQEREMSGYRRPVAV